MSEDRISGAGMEKRKMVKQNVEPVKAEEQTKKAIVIEDMTLYELTQLINASQIAIENKKSVILTDAVKAAKKAYQGLTAQGIAMPSDVFISSLKDLSDSERKTLQSEIEGGLKPLSFEEYAVLDDIRASLLTTAKMCNYRKSGRTTTGGGDRKVKLSNFTAKCPICGDIIGNPSGKTQKHLIVNQVRLHMQNKHDIFKELFNAEYRAIVNDTTIATEPVIEEIR